jgi:2-iminobutanoate/2-iminopropanoate deaminase
MSDRSTIATHGAPQPIGPYSQAIRANGFLLISGQIGIDPESQSINRDDIEGQVEQALINIEAILGAAARDRRHVVRCVVFLKDISHFTRMNEVYGRFFGRDFPARSTIAVAALPLNALVEIEATALESDRTERDDG